jgi:phospholipase/carboxylesterase
VLDCIEMTTGEAPSLAVIWLHGLGADGHDFEPIVPELRLGFPARFVFPHAPVRPVTINGGMAMRAWYDILGFDRNAKEDAAGIHASAAAVTKLVDREIERGMPANRIALAGFSQGGAIALHTALREPRRLAGVLALSTYVPLATTLAGERNAANTDLPIFMAHGTQDSVLPLALGESSRRLLETLGYAVDWHTYPMPHSVCLEEIEAIAGWLAALRQRRA